MISTTLHTSDPALASSIVTILEQGGVVALPTETIYGLCCDPSHEQALTRLFQIKERDPSKTVLCVTGEREQIDTLVSIPSSLEPLLQRFWPGPLTVIFPIRKEERMSSLIQKDGTIAIRHTPDALLREITILLGHPIVATSVNRTGHPFLYSAAEIHARFGDALDLVVETDHELLQVPSTIIKIDAKETVTLIREGAISWEEIQNSLRLSGKLF